jgi:CDP-diacylglycerol--serine O-phosphatidyltransferase
MANLRGVFPGAFTAGNLICGFLAMVSCIHGNPSQACWLVVLAAFLDGLDGFVAKVSKGTTRFGIEFDSLADIVSFGAAPALILYSYRLPFLGPWNWLLGAVFLLSAAFRLARFNLTATREEKNSFLGLPVPAAAVSILSFALFCEHLYGRLKYEKLLVTMIIGYSLLMVSAIEFEARPRTFRTARDRFKLLFILLAVAGTVIEPALAIFPVTASYVAFGLVREGFLLVRGTHTIRRRPEDSKKGGQHGEG